MRDTARSTWFSSFVASSGRMLTNVMMPKVTTLQRVRFVSTVRLEHSRIPLRTIEIVVDGGRLYPFCYARMVLVFIRSVFKALGGGRGCSSLFHRWSHVVPSIKPFQLPYPPVTCYVFLRFSSAPPVLISDCSTTNTTMSGPVTITDNTEHFGGAM